MSVDGLTDDTLPVEVRRLVADTCAQYRSNWQPSGPSSIEHFIEHLASSERACVFRALVALDVELRLKHGEHPSPIDYCKQFPLDASIVSSAFASLKTIAEPVESTFIWTGAEADASFSLGSSPQWTTALQRKCEATQGNESNSHPVQFGRYEVVQYLGEGAYGRVYLARDHALDRDVAIKVPKSKSLSSPDRLAALLNEGRSAAALKHPSIVSVFDAGRSDDGSVFVVLEYVKGITLAELLVRERVEPAQLAECIAEVADAIHHAHRAGLVHRDLKPSNIIIDKHGKPRVTDFGLALGEETQVSKAGEIAGTPAYMAPEQVRGEAHRLDGRTDVWALGVILYQGLTGGLPFHGESRAELFDEIVAREPKSPRQSCNTIPRELERICLKCLSKQMGDRFETALELSQDLHLWQSAATGATPTDQRRIFRVVPKGLRSFDVQDANFFLSLLPGPRDRDDLPQSIRHWKGWCEGSSDESTNPVGVLYGPSGSGKSSLVKAGLLPLLDPRVRTVYLEASGGETETRLLAQFHRQWPELRSVPEVVAAAAHLREGNVTTEGRKTLIIIDQFEQWLEGKATGPNCELVRALRHCDGNRLQALVLVRDDFWMATTRFFKWIDVPLIEGRNSVTAEPLDQQHARYILTEFGRACGRVPESHKHDSAANEFVEQAAKALVGPNGGIAPVHLSVFFEVVRKRPWMPATLRELGGVDGIAARFIEDALGESSSCPTHRRHRNAAQAVLRSMLPHSPSELRGCARFESELQREAGYEERDAEFTELMRILDSELRIVTPVEAAISSEGTPTGERRYQLTHDYLVEPLRLWLTQKQRETRRGRAKIGLEQLAMEWKQRHESRRLPALIQWLSIVVFTRHHQWSEDERQMMWAATRRLVVQTGIAVLLILAVGLSVLAAGVQIRRETLLDRISRAELKDVPYLLPDVDGNRGWLHSRLERLESASTDRSGSSVVIPLILFRNAPTTARSSVLRVALEQAIPEEVKVIRQALAMHPREAGLDDLERQLFSATVDPAIRLKVACVLSELKPAAIVRERGLDDALAAALLKEDRRSVPLWLQHLGPSASLLQQPLIEMCRDPTTDQTMLTTAAETLGGLLVQQGAEETLARALIELRPEAAAILRRELSRLPLSKKSIDLLYEVVDQPAPDASSLDSVTSRRANAAISLAAVGDWEELWFQLGRDADPQLRATLIDQLGTSGLEIQSLLERLEQSDVEPLERQALLMTFAGMPRNRLTSQEEAELATFARELYLRDPTAPVHSAAELLLRRLNRFSGETPNEPAASVSASDATPHWIKGPNGHEFAVLRAPLSFRMGSPPGAKGAEESEALHYRSIPRSLAVATKEATIAQFKRFKSDYYPGVPDELPFAANVVSWYDAVAYCNWLSEEAGIPPHEWCYPSHVSSGMAIDANAVERTGYRLPTEAEWECFARAGTETSRHFGQSEQLLPRYGWTWLNSGDETHIVGELLPNQFGLFDTLGNLWEWCHDGPLTDSWERPVYPYASRDRPAEDTVHDETIRSAYSWRITRGGAYNFTPTDASSAHRDVFRVENSAVNAGLRVVRTLPAKERIPSTK